MSHVENTVQGLMAKAQEFASAWAVVDGPFDDGGAMQRANESKAQLEAMIVAALHTSATSLKALHALILDGDLTEAARMCDQILAQQEQMVAVEPWKDHRTAALVNDLRDCAKTYGNTQQLRERIATIVAPLCAQLKTAELAAAPQAVQDAPLPLLVRDIARDLGITVPQACIALKPLGNYSTNSAVTAEMARMLRDHFPAPAHPADGVPDERAAFEAWLGIKPCGAAHDFGWAAWQARAALANTQPAAQGMDAGKLLAEKHTGMMVDYRGLLGQVQREIERSAPGHAEMLRQLQGHLQELGQRWYAGDTAVVDELLQLYCVEREARAALAAQAKQGGE